MGLSRSVPRSRVTHRIEPIVLQNRNIHQVQLRICSRCIYDERVPAIEFDGQGVCNYCRQVEALVNQFGTGRQKGEALFAEILGQIR